MAEAKSTDVLRDGLEKCIPSIVEKAKEGDLEYITILIKLCEKMLPEWKTKGRTKITPDEYIEIFNKMSPLSRVEFTKFPPPQSVEA